jgi:hypothetical protein
MSWIQIKKEKRYKNIHSSRLNRFIDEGWSIKAPSASIKQSPSKPKVSATVTKTKPKMTISKAKAEIIKNLDDDQNNLDQLEQEIFDNNDVVENDILGKEKGE